MEIINVPRAFGKTTNLIMRAVKTGYPIIVGTSSQKNVLKDKIRRITDKEVEVYTIFDFCDNNKFRGKDKPENILIDELPIVLSIMLNANVDMATMTSNSIEMYDIERKYNLSNWILISFGKEKRIYNYKPVVNDSLATVIDNR